jgi:chromosome segregation ATPase
MPRAGVAISRSPVSRLPAKLDLALTKRLREVVDGRPATESELRSLADQAGGWARATEAQLRAAEGRLAKLNADRSSPLAAIAAEVRRTEALTQELNEARTLIEGLEARTRELRTEYLRHHAESARPFSAG